MWVIPRSTTSQKARDRYTSYINMDDSALKRYSVSFCLARPILLGLFKERLYQEMTVDAVSPESAWSTVLAYIELTLRAAGHMGWGVELQAVWENPEVEAV